MAREFAFRHTSGLAASMYVTLQALSDVQYWWYQTAQFYEAYNATHYDDAIAAATGYAIPVVEIGTTGYYTADVPTGFDGDQSLAWLVTWRLQVGANPVLADDTVLGEESPFVWNHLTNSQVLPGDVNKWKGITLQDDLNDIPGFPSVMLCRQSHSVIGLDTGANGLSGASIYFNSWGNDDEGVVDFYNVQIDEATLSQRIAEYVWNALTSAHAVVSSFGTLLKDMLDVAIGTRATQASVDDIPTNAEMSAMFDALNQSASRRILLATSPQFERPESGSNTYKIQMRLYDADGSPTNATGTPTLTATGNVSGSLAANLSAATNPATGVYQWVYTETSAAVLEQIQFDGSAVLADMTATMSTFSLSADFVAATFTTADRATIDAILVDTAVIGTPENMGSGPTLAGNLTDINTGAQTFHVDQSVFNGQVYALVEGVDTHVLAVAPAVWEEAQADHTTPGTTGAATQPIFKGFIRYTKDEANAADRWDVEWEKDTVPITSGITVARISATKDSDGTAAFTNQTMTEIGATGVFKFVDVTPETAGNPLVVVATATIEGLTRTCRRTVSRDSSV